MKEIKLVKCKPDESTATKVSPVRLAEMHFGNRLRTKNGAFYLDGYPLNLDGVMRTLNTERQAQGIEQITNSDKWVV